MKKVVTIILIVILVLGASFTLAGCVGMDFDISKILTDYVNYDNLYVRAEYGATQREFSNYGGVIYVTDVIDNKIVADQYFIKDGDEYYNIYRDSDKYYKVPTTKGSYDELVTYMKETQIVLSNVSSNYKDYSVTGKKLIGKDIDGQEIALTFGADYLKYSAVNITYVFKEAKEKTLPEDVITDISLERVINRIITANYLTIQDGDNSYSIDGDIVSMTTTKNNMSSTVYYQKYDKAYYKYSPIADESAIPPENETAADVAPGENDDTPSVPPIPKEPKYHYAKTAINLIEYNIIRSNIDLNYNSVLMILPLDESKYIIDGNKYQYITDTDNYNLTLYGNMLAFQEGDKIVIYKLSNKIILPIIAPINNVNA